MADPHTTQACFRFTRWDVGSFRADMWFGEMRCSGPTADGEGPGLWHACAKRRSLIQTPSTR